jgi:hypothetical protein
MAEKEQKSSKTGNFLQEELQEEYLKSLDELEVGQLVEGTVVAVSPPSRSLLMSVTSPRVRLQPERVR